MPDYYSFIEKVHRYLGIDLSLYKEAQMRRRLTSLRNKRGFRDFDSYFTALREDDALLEEFIDRITINVSEFYRNPKRWDVLREKVFPKLIEQSRGRQLKIWSAACSTGEEPYSLSIMLHEHFPNVDAAILATDIDEKALKKAEKGVYHEQALKDLPNQKKTKYFTYKNDAYHIDPRLKKIITFKKHDLLKDPYPRNLDLIVCRNVLIYFTDDAKETIYQKLSDALVENGILFVGSTEQIFNPAKYHLTLFDTFFYEKKSK